MRLPVVDTRGTPLMPCTPAKARHLFTSGKARPKRNKLGLFYVQLTYEQEPDNQPLVAGIDPGSNLSHQHPPHPRGKGKGLPRSDVGGLAFLVGAPSPQKAEEKGAGSSSRRVNGGGSPCPNLR
jgi:hypothetical protein